MNCVLHSLLHLCVALSLSFFFKQLEQEFSRCLKNPSQQRFLIAFPVICSEFLNGTTPFCPEEVCMCVCVCVCVCVCEWLWRIGVNLLIILHKNQHSKYLYNIFFTYKTVFPLCNTRSPCASGITQETSSSLFSVVNAHTMIITVYAVSLVTAC